MSTQPEIMSREDVERNIDRLIAKSELLNGRLKRTTILLFGLAALYLLVSKAAVNQLDLGYILLNDMRLVRSLVAPLYAAYYLYFLITGYELVKVKVVLRNLMGESDPFKSNDNILNAQDLASAIQPFAFYDYFNHSQWSKIPKLLQAVLVVVILMLIGALFLPMAFIFFLLYVQWSSELDALGWASMSATLLLLVLIMFMQYAYIRVNRAAGKPQLEKKKVEAGS